MTPFRSCIPGLVALLCAWALPAAFAADETDPNTGGIFSTPGYPPRANPQGGPGNNNAGPAAPGFPSSPFIGNMRSGALGADGRAGRTGEVPGMRSEPRPPPRPSEFQRFVEAATGRLLPVFGAAFFSESIDTFNPVDNVPVSADYTVGPGDEIILRAWGSIDVDYRTTVDRNGLLNLPKIGAFNVAGVKASDLERHLRAQVGRLYTNFNLSVALGQLRSVKVFVVGPAQRPGVYTLPSQATLLSALVAAGGPAANGSMRKITLRRDGRAISDLDVYEFLVQGDKSKDLQLAAGDVIVFQPAGPRVALTGAVDNRAIYELRNAQEPLRELLRYAGGAPVLANPNKVQVERIDSSKPNAARFVEEFSLDTEGLAKPLRDGDVLTLLSISPQFANAVTLKGHVAQPLRYPYKPGMRIRDLIPEREALISPDFYRRKNLLVQVIEDDEVRSALDSRMAGRSGATSGVRNGSSPAAAAASSPTRGNRSASSSSSIDDGDPRNTVAGSAERRSREAERDADTFAINRFDGRPNGGPSERDAARAAAIRNQRLPMPLFDDLNWDYAVIERLNLADLKTQVIPFNLGKALLQNDEAHNLLLLPGDVVTIFGQQDVRGPVSRQTRLVSLEGEVNSPGVYQLEAGDTLRSLLARAGGFTPQAYVYGLEFSREETRVRQRENLASAIARLQTLSAVQSARDAANRRDDASSASSAAVNAAATRRS